MKKDKTFSDADVIRVWCEHLTAAEQFNVWLFFTIVLPAYIEREVGENNLFTVIVAILRDRLTFSLIKKVVKQFVNIELRVAEKIITSHFRRQKGGRKLVEVSLRCVQSKTEFLEVLRLNRQLLG